MKLLKISLMLTLLVAMVSFTQPNVKTIRNSDGESFSTVLRHEYAISSNSDNMVVSMEINTSNQILQLKVYRASDCVEHTNYGITSGYIYHSGSNYYAVDLVIDLGFYGTVTLNDLLNVGLSECDAN